MYLPNIVAPPHEYEYKEGDFKSDSEKSWDCVEFINTRRDDPLSESVSVCGRTYYNLRAYKIEDD